MVGKFYVLVAALYPLVAIATFFLTLRADLFALFDKGYLLSWLIFVPGILILMTIGLAYTGRAPGRFWRLGLIAWITLVTFGHYSMIGMAAAGV